MILTIDRAWNRDPGWFYTLPKAVQVSLLADFRIEHSAPDKSKTAKDKAKRRRFDRMRKRANRTGAIQDG